MMDVGEIYNLSSALFYPLLGTNGTCEPQDRLPRIASRDNSIREEPHYPILLCGGYAHRRVHARDQGVALATAAAPVRAAVAAS